MLTPDTSLADRLREVRERVRAAAERSGRGEDSVTLCAVTKTFPAEVVAEAIAAGVAEIGENRVQEAAEKRSEVEALARGTGAARWHLIGHLQSNKARRAVELFEVIQTIDSLALAERIERLAGELGRRPAVYVQVDLGREATKSGAREDEVAAIVERLGASEHARVEGLMTVPPYFEDPELVRPYFARLRELRDALNASGRLSRPLSGLSMGMSHDFEVAIEEGATLVRVGSAIFGSR